MLNELPLDALKQLVREAGAATLPFWCDSVAVERKADDSPVTAADLAANRILLDGLATLTPDIPVLSEESCDIALATRQAWRRWWLIDPLDGTKEFISGSDEFTVNLALIEQGRVLFGLVGVPAQALLYFGGLRQGAWREADGGEAQAIAARQTHTPLQVVASKRHSSPQQEALLAQLNEHVGAYELVSVGSSLKFCQLAQGKADLYPRLAPTSQWDTAAAQAVLEGADGCVLRLDGSVLEYPAAQSYLNPHFIALPADAPWREALLRATNV
ncbi:3'(2'),5'-bisphosphate nucleotidase CysQ [Atopomonas sediminilitoris]|uniref:3'(2'),5'-bisphosphate nucleotidase CysQ n=1 Tax=Atopomonas sediminilitoris TaxID=2919919 RepID=UPI001F4D3663|nr:3'(2'),5'-bisphosphate nucleotidase CysQ [Atopomonas sediminilitoris]MCJ8169416.1 3'(2'),5'-bisphosphate nucleotidase CysQ [Atopomonas sediminilitoris]